MRRERAPVVVLALMIAAYVVVFGTLTWHQQSNYGTFGFDMGIYDQGIWLLSRGHTPFVTVRGLHLFGHHVNPILFLLVPLYWVGADAHHLFLVETVALASAAVPVFLIARRETGGNGWLGCAAAGAYLLHPTVEWINWWHFHPDALAIAPLLWAWWFASTSRWRWFAVAIAVALSAKEDVGLAVAMLGVVLCIRKQWRAGLLTAAAGVAWFAFSTQVVIPHYLDGDPFYAQQFFPQYGDSLGSVMVGMVTSPGEVATTLTEASRLDYYTHLLSPYGWLPLASPVVLLVAAPQLAVNALSTLAGTHDFRFHYSALVIVALTIAAITTIGRLFRWRRWAGWALALWLLASAVGANVTSSPSPAGDAFDSGIWARRIPRHDVFDRAIDIIPAKASVTATYYVIPHVTHRDHAYEWPNPWKPSYYGLRGENAPDPATIDYLLIDTTLDQEAALLDELTGPRGDYRVILDLDSVLLACRTDICP